MCFIFCLEATFCNSGMDVNTVDRDRINFVLCLHYEILQYLLDKVNRQWRTFKKKKSFNN